MASAIFKAAPYHAPADPLARVLGYLDFRASILRGELPQFTCFLGTMLQETYETHPKIRAACERHITEHAAEIAKDLALAKQKYAAGAKWSPASVAIFSQASLQGAFILAKARDGPEIAAECVAHLRQYMKSLFAKTTANSNPR